MKETTAFISDDGNYYNSAKEALLADSNLYLKRLLKIIIPPEERIYYNLRSEEIDIKEFVKVVNDAYKALKIYNDPKLGALSLSESDGGELSLIKE